MVAQLALDTPGSKTDRALSLDFVLNHKDKKLEAGFTSPWKKASLKGALQNDKARKEVNLILISDKDEYALKSFVNIAEKGSETTYTPVLEFRRPGAEGIALKGTIISEENEDIEADFKLSGATEKTVNIKGKYVNSNKMKSLSASVAIAPKNVYSTTASITIDQKKKTITKVLPSFVIKTPEGTLVSLTGSADYRKAKSLKTDLTLKMDRLLKQPIIIKGNLNRGFYFLIVIHSKAEKV
ncbi:hypothetical protein LOTGIDRAFT_112317 [Lottia gigantea]|uniref:Lipid transport open beta-sheet domain-containing protein n=1 Tax=Lottia gigantea TaxID=225164 RepID=V4A9R7_LOTGI|nr:hypothetical protein LOTGIDRAFT_112317 [Lottia gigantea]ESP00734.1 hypothetical protein LOTGIDRAFT_112317 [Lottia gigantea]